MPKTAKKERKTAMALKPGDKINFDTLQRAFANGDVALMECQDAQTHEYVAVLCAANRREDGVIDFAPLARMFQANPYDEVIPSTDPGFVEANSPTKEENRRAKSRLRIANRRPKTAQNRRRKA
jgi:hypothetical protein